MRDAIRFVNNDSIEQFDFGYHYKRGELYSVHISDLHFPVMDPKVQYNILEEQFLGKVQNLPRLDLVCINGDLYDHKVMTSSDATLYASMFVARLVDICKEKNATLIILQGTISHDANQLKIYLHYMNRTDVDVRIVTNIQFEIVKNARILCIPELYGIPEEIYQNYLTYSGFYDLAIMHGTFHGAVMKDNAGNGRVFFIDDFNNCRGPIIAGHVHKPGCFDKHFYYCGSPYRWRFDDDHEKGFILLAQSLDTGYYYLWREEIISSIYKTITLSELINNNPKDTIDYINKIKQDQNIDYIRIKFDFSMDLSNKMQINNQYKNNEYVSLEYFSQEKEMQREIENKAKENNKKYSFLVDSGLSDYQKFVMWVNMAKGIDNYITVEELESLLSV